MTIPSNDNPTSEATARAAESADRIFADPGLDPEVDGEAYDAVKSWFARWDDQIAAMERGEDDGCPCEACRTDFGPLEESDSTT